MNNIKHLLRVTSAWISIVYVICFGGVALAPGIREWFMRYALHTNVNLGENVMTITTFVAGLVIWNVVALLAVWIFAYLYNTMKE